MVRVAPESQHNRGHVSPRIHTKICCFIIEQPPPSSPLPPSARPPWLTNEVRRQKTFGPLGSQERCIHLPEWGRN